MKLTPQLYCLKTGKVNGTARTKTDKCPWDALGGNPAANAAPKEGWAQQGAHRVHPPPFATATVLVPSPNRVLAGSGSISKPSFIPWIYFHTCVVSMVPVLKKQIRWNSASLTGEHLPFQNYHYPHFIYTPSQGYSIQ